MTDKLVAWLRAQIDEDQRIAESTRQASTSWGTYEVDGEVRDDVNAGTVCFVPHPEDRDHIARHDPARALREIAAKRAIIDEHGPGSVGYNSDECRTCAQPEPITSGSPDDHLRQGMPHPCATLRALAAVYAGRDGYEEAIKA